MECSARETGGILRTRFLAIPHSRFARLSAHTYTAENTGNAGESGRKESRREKGNRMLGYLEWHSSHAAFTESGGMQPTRNAGESESMQARGERRESARQCTGYLTLSIQLYSSRQCMHTCETNGKRIARECEPVRERCKPEKTCGENRAEFCRNSDSAENQFRK